MKKRLGLAGEDKKKINPGKGPNETISTRA
jgi:hypothetical protein